jgi:hypothetical protein
MATAGDQDAVSDGTEDGDAHARSSTTSLHEVPAQAGSSSSPGTVPASDEDREHPDTESGTEPKGDRPNIVPDNAGDREHADTETGTEPDGDCPHTVPVPRTPKARASRKRPRSGQSARSRKQAKLTVEEMVERVRPHVPALLARDGNESLTRVQLREILRDQHLQGGRNERLTPVLQRLRDEASTTTTRSTSR